MKTTKNIARLAVTAGLTAALSFGGVMNPVAMAFAADGSVTIENVKDNATEFKGYQIFKADVATVKGETVASNITWANDDVEAAVEGVINTVDTSYAGTTAQDAADWIAKKVRDENSSVAFNSTAYKIADAVDGLTADKTTVNRVASDLAHGYWLFVTSDLDPTKPNTGTSPIFVVVGDAAVNIVEKTSIPTVVKKVLDDSKVTGVAITEEDEANWKDAADSQVGQEVNYRLTGTIADNYDSYDSYSYKFKDQLTDGLDYINDGSLSVYALNNGEYTEIDPSSYKVDAPSESNKRVLTVNFIGTKGLKSATAKNGETLTINANTNIVVFYKAKLNAKAVIAGVNGELKGNPNTVTLEYSNNPMVEGTGTSAPDTVEDYTYGLRINKVDLGTERALKDAKFTITTNGDENSAEVKYVTKDGTLSGSKVELSTDDDGVIKLTGLDAGVYTVTETSAPEGYTTVQSFTFEIKPTMTADDPCAGLTGLAGVLDSKGQDGKVIAGLNDNSEGKVGDNKLEAKAGTTTNFDGTFNITVGNTKQINLPLTGLNGVTFTWIAGGAVLCIGVAHLIRSRKQAEESEQE